MREGADSFLGEIGGVASWSAGAEVSGQSDGEREGDREKERDENDHMLTKCYNCLPEPNELAVGEGEIVVNGLLSVRRR